MKARVFSHHKRDKAGINPLKAPSTVLAGGFLIIYPMLELAVYLRESNRQVEKIYI